KGRRGGGLKPTLRRTQPPLIPPKRAETGKYGDRCSKQREKPDWDDSDGIGGVEVADKVGWLQPPKQRQTGTTANKGRRGGGLKPALRRTQPPRIPPKPTKAACTFSGSPIRTSNCLKPDPAKDDPYEP
ncbi:hypothetical protein NEIPOLOT_02576, partial [Neisseria polysaccharea ATCC 43768]